jgi:hypothetical protein
MDESAAWPPHGGGHRTEVWSRGVDVAQYECLEIFPIHPQAAGQFRQALYPSGSKSDANDADLLLELLVHHREHLRPLER